MNTDRRVWIKVADDRIFGPIISLIRLADSRIEATSFQSVEEARRHAEAAGWTVVSKPLRNT